MNHNATNERRERFWIWLIWLIVLTSAMSSALSTGTSANQEAGRLLLGIAVESEKERAAIFPWQRLWRVKKWAHAKYKAWQRQYR